MALIDQLSEFFDFFKEYQFLGIADISISPLDKEHGSVFDIIIKKWRLRHRPAVARQDAYHDRYTTSDNLLIDRPEGDFQDALLSFRVQSSKSKHKNVALFRSQQSDAPHLILCFYKPFEIHTFWKLSPSEDDLSNLPKLSYQGIGNKIRRLLLGKGNNTRKISDLEKRAWFINLKAANNLLSYESSPDFIKWVLSAFGHKKHEVTVGLKLYSMLEGVLAYQAKKAREEEVVERIMHEDTTTSKDLEKLPPAIRDLFLQVTKDKGGVKVIGILGGAVPASSPISNKETLSETDEQPQDKEEVEEEVLQTFPRQYFYAPYFIEIMNRYVVGQEEAKNTLAVVLCKHFRRLALMEKGVEVDKNNLLMVGPSGTGKTSLIKAITENLDISYIKVDANSLTQTGYVGRNVSDIFASLIKKVGGNLKKAEESVLVIDEIDKIRSFNDDALEVSNKSVQSELLSVIDGEDVYLGDSEAKSMIGSDKISTKKMLVICLGAFSGIEKIVERRMKARFGFQSFATGDVAISQENSQERVFRNIKAEDIKKYGFQAEFVGRMHTITHFRRLKQADYMKIIKDLDMSMVKQLKEDFKLIGITIDFEEEALLEITKHLQEDDLGARQIKHVFSKVMRPYYLQNQELLEEGQEILISKKDVVQLLQSP